jgi:hypothetical protein
LQLPYLLSALGTQDISEGDGEREGELR